MPSPAHAPGPAGVPPAPFDGIAGAWFDDIESAHAGLCQDQWADIVAQDEENFLDRSKTRVVFSTDEVEYQP
jgi:hypothetical protein